MPKRPANRELAERLIADGQAIFPCSTNKKPMTPRSFHDAELDIKPWLDRPHLLIGLPTSGHWVTDLDAPLEHCVPLLVSMLKMDWCDVWGKCALIVQTPGNGVHLYWKRCDGLAVRTAASDIAKGIDTRGHRATGQPTGYTIAPGCILPDGRQYEVVKGGLGKLSGAPTCLRWLAAFSKAERGLIASNPDLTRAMKSSHPSEWRDLFDESKRPAPSFRKMHLSSENVHGYHAQYLNDLDAECQRLANSTDGRRQLIFTATARLARYVVNGIGTPAEAEAALLTAWTKCNGAKAHGLGYARGAIRRAIEGGANDPLPALANRFRTPRDGGHNVR